MQRGRATHLQGGLGACFPDNFLGIVQFGAFWSKV